MARMDDLVLFAQQHGLKIGTIRDLIAYRRRNDHLVQCIAEIPMTSVFGGDWIAKTYVNRAEYAEHLVLQKGKPVAGQPTMVRMHALSIFPDMLGDLSSRDGQLQKSMQMIGEEGSGIVVVIRDISPHRLSREMQARAGTRPADMDLRDYGIGAQILVDLGVHDMILLTNSHKTFVGLDGYGLNVVEERSIPPFERRV